MPIRSSHHHWEKSESPMRLFMILPRLAGGGMERMRLHLLQEFQAAGVETFLVVGQLQGELVELVPSGVPVLEIAPRGPLQFFPGLVRALHKHRPTHILSAPDDVNIMTIMANKLARTQAHVVVSNHNMLSERIARATGLEFTKLWAIRALMRWFYPLADGIVAVSHGAATDPDATHCPGSRAR